VDKGNTTYIHNGALFNHKEGVIPFAGKWMKL
jgi:hypothetical protein